MTALTRTILVAALAVGGCKDHEPEAHASGTIELTGQPPYAVDQCVFGNHYDINGARIFSKGPIAIGSAKHPGELLVYDTHLTYSWPTDLPPPRDALEMADRLVMVDVAKDCPVFSDEPGHLHLDCRASGGRRLQATLEYKCW